MQNRSNIIQLIYPLLRRLTLGSVCCLISTGFLVRAALAENPIPEQAVKTFLETIGSMKFPASDPALQAELVRQANAYLDVEAMGSRALADHWAGIPGEERTAFFDLLRKLVENVAYPRNRNLIEDEVIVYGEAVAAGDGFQVPVTLMQEDGAPAVSMSYHLTQEDGRWKIDDAVLDDVSITQDLKYQFDKIIAKSGFSGLLEKMRERLAKAGEVTQNEKPE